MLTSTPTDCTASIYPGIRKEKGSSLMTVLCCGHPPRMARKPRVQYEEGAVYEVMSRGDRREPIFNKACGGAGMRGGGAQRTPMDSDKSRVDREQAARPASKGVG
jgi:hypothetical protein